jgi:hypothetical protein
MRISSAMPQQDNGHHPTDMVSKPPPSLIQP